MKLRLFIALLFLMALTSCEKKRPAEAVLRKYVHYLFSDSRTLEGTKGFTTSFLAEKMSKMSAEDFSDYSQEMKSVSKRKFKVNLVKCREDECYITYTIIYKMLSPGPSLGEVEVKKIAQMKNIEGIWKISAVTNIKSFYEMKDELVP